MDINDKIAENVGLVYKQLSRFNLAFDQDAESFGYEALYRAVLTYDASTGNAFSTYATCVIANELRKYLRTKNKKRQLEVVSYYEPVTPDSECYMLDTIRIGEDAESVLLNKELYAVAHEIFNEVIHSMPDLQQKIILMWYESDCIVTQSKIAAAMKVAQPTVSKALSVFKYKFMQKLEEYM